MGARSRGSAYDVIVIGSGMGGMTTAAALARFDYKVLLLEQAPSIGGFTHAFSRDGFSWDIGLHYCGTFGHDQAAGKLLDWLSGGAIQFQSVGTVYDTLHFPDGFDISVGRPAEAYKMELKERFPENAAEIDAYFAAILSAEKAGQMVGAEHAMPDLVRSLHHLWNGWNMQHWSSRTTKEVISQYISNPKLAAVLSAQWGTYGGRPSEASFAIHAVIMGHYLEGAGYPVGGAGAIAKGLIPVIEAAGGSARAGTPVSEIVFEDGKAVGVRTRSGQEIRAPAVVSAIGAGETVKHLLPEHIREQPWAQEIATFEPSVCHFQVFLGFEGDIARYGASRSNDWFYETWNTDSPAWTTAEDDPIPMMFVSFPSLKDPAHDPGPMNKHTGELLVFADWSSVSEFVAGRMEAHTVEWDEFKQRIESRMMAFFEKKYPALAPLVVYRELGTPLATVSFTGHDKGGIYGVETTPRRMLSDSLNARTPVPGLYLAGQDVMTPGIAGALAGGMIGAAAIEPRVIQKLR